MENVALKKPALQSSVSQWSGGRDPAEDASIGNDGQIDDRFFHTDADLCPWWQVDLGEEFALRQLEILTRTDIEKRLQNVRILSSADGVNWFEVVVTAEWFSDSSRINFKENDYRATIVGSCLTRFMRIYLRTFGYLYFRECRIFGDRPVSTPEPDYRLNKSTAPDGRVGRTVLMWPLTVFVDTDRYAPDIVGALERGDYEGRERYLVSRLVQDGDRVIEVGTAAGIVAMTAALIVGPEHVRTFEANPEIAADASANFVRNGLGAINASVGLLRSRSEISCLGYKPAKFHINEAFWASRVDASSTDKGFIKTIEVPIFCLEDEIEAHGANVLICDIEGAEAALLLNADVSRLRLIIMETHYGFVSEVDTDRMVNHLIASGFSIHLGWSERQMLILRRHD